MTNIFLQTSKILQLPQVYLNQNIIWETSNLLSISFFFKLHVYFPLACTFQTVCIFLCSIKTFYQVSLSQLPYVYIPYVYKLRHGYLLSLIFIQYFGQSIIF